MDKRYIQKILDAVFVLTLALFVGSAFAGPVPNPGISQARAPLARTGSTVVLTTNGTIKAAHLYGTTGTFGVITVNSCVGCSGGSGGGGSGQIKTASTFNPAFSQVSTVFAFPTNGDPNPPSSTGSEILAVSMTVTTASDPVLVTAAVEATWQGSGPDWFPCGLYKDSDTTLSRVTHGTLTGGGSAGPFTTNIAWLDTNHTAGLHTWHLRCGPISGGETVNINGRTGGGIYGTSNDTYITAIELGSSGGGGGGGPGVTDPLTVNGWAPASGTATVTGAQSVTGSVTVASISAGSAAISGSETVGGNETASGNVTGNIVISAGGAFETPGGITMELIPPSGRTVRVKTSGTRGTCDGAAAGGLWYQSGAGPGATKLSVCLCGTVVVPPCAWVDIASY